ncbi:MAG: hypothetical protein AAB798_01350 [Patescibacteria group bacterium]
MSKDYFQDIMPPNANDASHPNHEFDSEKAFASTHDLPEKTIRNIQVPVSARIRSREVDLREPALPPKILRFGRWWLWIGVALALLVLGAIALLALRQTSVTVIPRSYKVSLDETTIFNAHPVLGAATGTATGTLGFTLETVVLEDSEIVPAKGVELVEEKASGTIIIYNEYSTQPVKLLKNTRFATPEGLIFRIPAEVIVPGKKGSIPGKISVTVFADAAGEKYNVGTVARFILPGLKSSPAMFSSVYASGKDAITGGFSGERPAASKQDIDAARANIRDRIHKKILETVHAKNSETTIAFVDLAYIAFESMPQTTEAEGSIKIHERARIELPVFAADNFAFAVAKSASADVENESVILKDADRLTAHLRASAEIESAIQFTLQGSAQLIWKVDARELSQAIAGRDRDAFEAIIGGFSNIEEAHARIQPFWKNSFPEDASKIRIKMIDPKPAALERQ